MVLAMGGMGVFQVATLFFLVLCLSDNSVGSIQYSGRLNLGFRGSQMTYIDNNGLILTSNNKNFSFGFNPTQEDVTKFLLVVIYQSSSTVIWSANRASPVQNSDNLIFDDSGNLYLQSDSNSAWSTDTANKGVIALELRDSGNLVLIGNDSSVIWESFSHPSDTLLSNQQFTEGMKLVSDPNPNNLSYTLEIKSGDLILSANFQPPQAYWALGKDSRRIINRDGGSIVSATLVANSWRFYDQGNALLSQLIYTDNTDPNVTRMVVLGSDGFIAFSILPVGGSSLLKTIPQDGCSRPAACNQYLACSGGNICQCPSAFPSCRPGIDSLCSNPKQPVDLVDAGAGLSYAALGFVSPTSNTDLESCKASCLGNCSCVAMFFDTSSRNCYLLDRIGSLDGKTNGSNYATYLKFSKSSISDAAGGGSKRRVLIVIIIVICTVIIILGLICLGVYYHQKKKNKPPDSPKDASEEENFLEGLSGMPIRFSYKDLEAATNNFSIKLGQGGFGSVYQGVLPDGTRLAVKQLEGIGQGKKEFRAEVSIIGSIHHLHLVRLKGFCAEGTHRLLAYEYMANGSLERWLFKRKEGEFMLDWDTRYNIAVGTAKGLAYLHEDCDVKIVHCDIKPENVLLDDHFHAKVSDFGLAKLMTREQSHVFTTLRGTRGYLAPEWITNYAISEKSDVYSYGMVLLEIIGGRKNYDPSETSEKSHFPSYAFKMMEEGKLKELIDSKLKMDEADERFLIAVRVALWCIQDDMYLRPSMTKVVQMLEGLCPVPPPPTASQLGSRLYSSFFKSISEEGTSSATSGPSDCNSDAYLSAVRLSGPR